MSFVRLAPPFTGIGYEKFIWKQIQGNKLQSQEKKNLRLVQFLKITSLYSACLIVKGYKPTGIGLVQHLWGLILSYLFLNREWSYWISVFEGYYWEQPQTMYWNGEREKNRHVKEERCMHSRRGQRHLDTWVCIKFHSFICKPK